MTTASFNDRTVGPLPSAKLRRLSSTLMHLRDEAQQAMHGLGGDGVGNIRENVDLVEAHSSKLKQITREIQDYEAHVQTNTCNHQDIQRPCNAANTQKYEVLHLKQQLEEQRNALQHTTSERDELYYRVADLEAICRQKETESTSHTEYSTNSKREMAKMQRHVVDLERALFSKTKENENMQTALHESRVLIEQKEHELRALRDQSKPNRRIMNVKFLKPKMYRHFSKQPQPMDSAENEAEAKREMIRKLIVIYLMTNSSRRLCSATRKTILERKQTPRDQGRGLCPRPSRRLFARSRIFGVLLKHKAKRRCVVRSIILSSWPPRRYICTSICWLMLWIQTSICTWIFMYKLWCLQ